jgi:predicted ABC-type ATPase
VTKPYFVILAGPNGVGKTTFAHANLGEFIKAGAFLNADDIARGIRPSDVAAVATAAARKMLVERRSRLSLGRSFCVETTLATRTLLRFVDQARAAGFRARLIFLFTPFPQLNELRVKQRVMAGGHNIATETINRRHRAGCSQTIGTLATNQSCSMRARSSPRKRWSRMRAGQRLSIPSDGPDCRGD